MDVNLHSFILVIGIFVIMFIVIDGIKKVREARANQFEEDLIDDELLSSDGVPDPHQSDEASFGEYEIADDLVSGAFVADLGGDAFHVPTADDESDVQSEQAFINEADLDGGQIESADSFDIQNQWNTEPESVQEESFDISSDQYVEQEETFESFNVNDSLHYDNINTDSDSIIETGQKLSQASSKVLPRKVHSDQPSKAEVESRRRQLESEQQAFSEKVTEPLLDVPESVPVLMEPIELGAEVDPNPPVQHEMILPEFVQQTLHDAAIIAVEEEPEFESFTTNDDDQITESDPQEYQEYQEPRAIPVGEKLSARPPAEEIFVINVVKESQPLLQGAELHHIFKVCDMRHGEMDIFHRFEKENAQGKIQFSVVNAMEPGTFDLDTIDTMETKGISLFMSLPGPEDAMGAFDAMAEVALVFARNFNASMYDESHSDLTPQTLEHYRNRIREYSRKQFTKK